MHSTSLFESWYWADEYKGALKGKKEDLASV
jgi:hypothetical protein